MLTWKKYKLGEVAELVKESTNPTNGGVKKYIGLEHIGQGTFLLESIGSSDDVARRLKNDLENSNYKFWENENDIKLKLAPFSWLIVNSKAFVLIIALNLLLWKYNEPNRAIMYDLSIIVVAVFGIWVFSLPRYYIQYYYFKIRKKLNIEEYKDLRIPWVLGISSVIDVILISLIIKTLISEEFTLLIDNFFN